jgi:endoglucanase
LDDLATEVVVADVAFNPPRTWLLQQAAQRGMSTIDGIEVFIEQGAINFRLWTGLEPERTIILGSNRWNSAITFYELDVPADDANIILTFHFYNPMLITHYRAPWTPVGRYEGPVHYPGQPIKPEDWGGLAPDLKALLGAQNVFYNGSVMERDLAPALAVQRRTHLVLYCGEFGVHHAAPDPVRIAWYRDFRGVLARHGIAWANWDYKGSFGLFDAKGNPTAVVEGLLK